MQIGEHRDYSERTDDDAGGYAKCARNWLNGGEQQTRDPRQDRERAASRLRT